MKHSSVCGCMLGTPASIDACQVLQRLRMHLLTGCLVQLPTMLIWILAMNPARRGLSYAFTVVPTVQVLFLGSSLVTRHGCWSVQLLIPQAMLFIWLFILWAALGIFVLPALLGLVAGVVTVMQLGWFAALWALFLTCFLQTLVHWVVLFHLLCGGHCKLQAFVTGEATLVVTDYDVIQESIIIFYDKHANGATWHLVFLSSLRDRVKHAWSSGRIPNGVTMPPSNTTMVRGHPSSLANSNKCLILWAVLADFAPATTLDFCGSVW